MSLDALLHFVSHSAGSTEQEAELAFVEADARGRVASINPQARLAWGWRVGTDLPGEILVALSDLDPDVPTDLPLMQNGLRLRAMAKDHDDGWFLVGWQADSPSVHAPPRTSPPRKEASLMDRLPGPAIRLGPTGLASYVNEGTARAMGESVEDLLGRPVLAELLHSRDRWKVAEMMEVAARQGAAQTTVRYGRDGREGILHVVLSEPDAYDIIVIELTGERSGTDITRNALRELATSCADPWMFRDGALNILKEELNLDQAVLYAHVPGRQGLIQVGDDVGEGTGHSALPDMISTEASLRYKQRGGLGTPIREATHAWTAPVHDNGQFVGLLVLMWPEGANMPDADSLDELTGLFESLYSWIQVCVRYRTSVNAIDDALFGFSFREDERRQYHFATHQMEQMTGRSAAYITSEKADWMESIVLSEDVALVRAHNKNLMAGNESRVTYRVEHSDGSVRWLREHATPRVEATGFVSVNGMIADVTEQKTAEMVLVQAKREAESAARAKTSFIATMSHEIRTPLGAVNGFAQLLQREIEEFEEELGDDLPEPIHEFTEAIADRSQKLLSLIHDLFELSNLEMGHTTLQNTSVNLAPIIQRVADRLEPNLHERGVSLRLEMGGSRYMVQGDARRIEQVLENLASNAAKFTEEGEVVFAVSDRTEDVEIQLRDTGIGISEDYLEELFEAFSQEDEWKNRRFEGTGLGLALVKRLLALMEGTITVESEKGVGSTFVIRLPKVMADRAPLPHAGLDLPVRFEHSA